MEPEIPIPEPVSNLYDRFRPTPLRRMERFERRLRTACRFYCKLEGYGSNPVGSHKLNLALAQAYYYKKAAVEELVSGTGAGQWGTALAFSCGAFKLGCEIFMVGVSADMVRRSSFVHS